MTTIARTTLDRLRSRSGTDFDDEPTFDDAYEGFELAEAEPLPPPPVVLVMTSLVLPPVDMPLPAGPPPDDFTITEEAFFSAGDAMATQLEETAIVDLSHLVEAERPALPVALAPTWLAEPEAPPVAAPFPLRAPPARPERKWLLALC